MFNFITKLQSGDSSIPPPPIEKKPSPPQLHENPKHMVVYENNECSNSTLKCWYGRFGNQFIRNVCASFLAKKYDLKFQYKFQNDIQNMGIDLFTDGTRFHKKTLSFKDEYFDKFMDNDTSVETVWDGTEEPTPETHNIDVNFIYLQTRTTAKYIRNYVNEREIAIKNSNPFRERYGNNNDIFIHLRLGDALHYAPPFDYYRDTIIEVLKRSSNGGFGKRFISSDTLNHPLCQKLIYDFGLFPIQMNEINTIQFASTCSNIILSNGTFSWLIGVLAFNSNIYYPQIKTVWHGDIFIFPDWNEMAIG